MSSPESSETTSATTPSATEDVAVESAPATVPDAAAQPTAEAVPDAAPKPAAKPRPVPKPGAARAPSPSVIAAHSTHPVKVPVAIDVSPEEFAAAEKFGSVKEGVVADVVSLDSGELT